jgi:aspartate/methionine/tyrosine aminotransferase
MLFAALLEKGDEVIISDPHYACYPNFIKFVDGRPVTVPVYEEDGFQYRPEAIARKDQRTNPGDFHQLPLKPHRQPLSSRAHGSHRRSLAPYIVSDEIYHGLVYEGQEHSILEYTENAFVLNGFSKLYAMTGMRLGYLIAPRAFRIVRPIQKLHQNFFISANAAVQQAGIAALEEAAPDCEAMRRTYDKRRRFMIQRLRQMGLGITVEPTGAFYVFANVKHISTDSYALAFDILEKAHVGVTPGIDFGQRGEGYLRFSYATAMSKITEAMDRLENYLERHTRRG